MSAPCWYTSDRLNAGTVRTRWDHRWPFALGLVLSGWCLSCAWCCPVVNIWNLSRWSVTLHLGVKGVLRCWGEKICASDLSRRGCCVLVTLCESLNRCCCSNCILWGHGYQIRFGWLLISGSGAWRGRHWSAFGGEQCDASLSHSHRW